MLFLAWIAVSFIAVALINIYLRHFGLPRRIVSCALATDGKVLSSGTSSLANSILADRGESAQWINKILTWISQQAPNTQQRKRVTDAWLKSLNEEVQHYSSEMKIQFDDVRGSLPELSNFSVDLSTAGSGRTPSGLTLNLSVIAKDITLQVCVVKQLAETSRILYADVYILHLQGQLKVTASTVSETLIQISFASKPDTRLQLLPSGRVDPSIDVAIIEKTVRAALAEAVVKITWSQTGGFRGSHVLPQQPIRIDAAQQAYPIETPTGHSSNQQNVYNVAPQQSFNVPEPARQQMTSSAPFSQQLQTQQQPQHVPCTPQQSAHVLRTDANMTENVDMLKPCNIISQDTFGNNNLTTQRLLIKVIKANGLADDQGSCNAYCVVRVDQPAQTSMTSIIQNTSNPIWDEHFVFDVNNFTRQIQFEVLDRDKQPDSELLGKTVVNFDEIRRMPSSRQIVPLTGRLRSRTATSGSVTAEFVLMDAADLNIRPAEDNMTSMRVNSQQVPCPPGPSNFPLQANKAGIPNYSGSLSNDTMTKTCDVNRLSAHDLALSQQGGNKQSESPTLIVTSAGVQRTNMHGNMDARGRDGRGHDGRGRDTEKKESFASALKKRLSRGGGKKRSQSADRAQETSAYLRPPADSLQGYRTTETVDIATERQARSNSFTSSLRRIFKPTSSGDAGKKELSREGSSTRNCPTQPYNSDRSLRQNTPVPADRRTVEQLGTASSARLDNTVVDQYGRTTPVMSQVSMTSQGALIVGRY